VWGRLRRQCRKDCLEDAVDISDHVIIPKAQNAIAMFTEPCIPDDIALAVCVLTTINFNNEPMLATDKIGHIAAYRLLADEFEAV
jgi:hypothetical protein